MLGRRPKITIYLIENINNAAGEGFHTETVVVRSPRDLAKTMEKHGITMLRPCKTNEDTSPGKPYFVPDGDLIPVSNIQAAFEAVRQRPEGDFLYT